VEEKEIVFSLDVISMYYPSYFSQQRHIKNVLSCYSFIVVHSLFCLFSQATVVYFYAPEVLMKVGINTPPTVIAKNVVLQHLFLCSTSYFFLERDMGGIVVNEEEKMIYFTEKEG